MARRHAILAAAVAAISFLGLWTAAAVHGAVRVPPALSPARTVRAAALRLSGWDSGLSACEQELERAQPRGVPRLAIVGASFTAGVGSGPGRSWAVLLARQLRWDAVVYGVPGAGYVRVGGTRRGPVTAELARIGLAVLKPSLVIVQAGHDDIGVSAGLEQQRVAQAIALIRADAPEARIALVTVFIGRSPPAAADRTDRAIVRAARAADRTVIIVDPLAARWRFPHVHDGLHPTAAGSVWIAARVAAVLRQHGVTPVPARAGAGYGPLICARP